MNGFEKRVLFLLASVNFTHILDFMIMMPLGNFLIPYFHISASAFSFLVAAYTFSAGITGFAAAFFVDRFDRKQVLIVGYSGFLIGTLFCAIAPTYWLLLVSRIVAGLFGGLIGAQVISIVADIFPYERRGAAMGAMMSAFSMASILGVPLSLYLAKLISWHAPFFLVAAIGFVNLLLLNQYLPKMNRHLEGATTFRSPLTVLQSVIAAPEQRAALAFSACMMLGHFLIIPFLNPYMEFNVGFTKAQTPLVYLVGGIATFISSFVLGKMTDMLGKLRMFTWAAVLSLIPIYLITHMPAIPFQYVLVVTALWFVLATARNIPAQAMISNVVNPAHRGSFMSFNSSMQQLATGSASIIAGLIVVVKDEKVYHYSTVGFASIAIIVIAIFLARRLDERQLQ